MQFYFIASYISYLPTIATISYIKNACNRRPPSAYYVVMDMKIFDCDFKFTSIKDFALVFYQKIATGE